VQKDAKQIVEPWDGWKFPLIQANNKGRVSGNFGENIFTIDSDDTIEVEFS
jgi:hypothetical protein